jgi:hypothetical protein
MDLLSLFVEILFICVVAGLFYWVIGALGTPDPIGKIARVAIVFIASLILIYVLFGHFGGGYIGHHTVVNLR